MGTARAPVKQTAAPTAVTGFGATPVATSKLHPETRRPQDEPAIALSSGVASIAVTLK